MPSTLIQYDDFNRKGCVVKYCHNTIQVNVNQNYEIILDAKKASQRNGNCIE